MFYKKSEENWLNGTRIALPNGVEITEVNKDEHEEILVQYGWTWHDTPPQEYLDWLKQQNEEEE